MHPCQFSSYEGATQANLNAVILPQISDEIKQTPDCNTQARYWVEYTEVENNLGVNTDANQDKIENV
ncbi:MAG: hypothetical protein WBA39_29145 [Rivularia sp. (in: cyanobacteria)]